MTSFRPSTQQPLAPAVSDPADRLARPSLMPEPARAPRRRGWAMLAELPGPLLVLVDLTAVAAALLLVPAPGTSEGWRVIVGCAILLGLLRQRAHRATNSRMLPTRLARAITAAGLGATTIVLAARSLLASGPPAPELLALGLGATVATVAARGVLQLAAREARRRGLGTVPTLIVGAGVVGRQLERRMQLHPELGFAPVGFLDDDPSPLGQLDAGHPATVLGPTSELGAALSQTGARHVVFSFTRAPDSEVLPLLRDCQRAGVDVSVMPRLFENVNGRVRVEQLAGLPLLALRQTNPKSWQFSLKHASDRVLAAVLLVLLAPLAAAIATAIMISSPGPVLYRQERVGRDGRPFQLLKFRSMRAGSPTIDEAVLTRLEIAGLGPGGVEGEDRRTRVGRFLRRSGLDELPQLLNVLRGEMSIVGPRPERPELADRFGERVRRYGDRHLVRSGITGWAQVNGLRGQTSIAERIEWDNWYIQNWSLGLDLLTVVLTPWAIVRTPSEDDVARGNDASTTG